MENQNGQWTNDPFLRDMAYAGIGMLVGKWIGELITSIAQARKAKKLRDSRL